MSLLLIETVIKSSGVLAIAAMANTLLHRRQSAASKHLVWTLAVAGLLALPVLSALLPRWEVEIPVAGPDAAIAVQLDEPVVSDIAAVDRASAVETSSDSRSVATTAEGADGRTRVAWVTVLPVVYAAVVLLLMIRLVRERWMVGRLARRAAMVADPEWTQLLSECASQMGVTRPVRLLRSLERSMPMAFGIARPSILVPSIAETWSEDRRRAVLLHELAHIARHDCLTQLMAAAACALYWIHPGVWWVARRLRVERELACDDRVLRAGAHAREYAEHLLELAYTLGGYRAPALVVAMARPRQVEGRMLAVLDAERNRAIPAWRGRLAGVAVTAALLLPIAAVQGMLVPARAASVDRAATPDAAADREAADATTLTEKGVAGTWELRTSQTASTVYLRLSDSASSSHGTTIPVARLEGLAPALLSGAGGAATFDIRRDAGVLAFEGTFRSGVGAGTYTFAPSAIFPAELAKRGLARPTAADQYVLARGDIGFAFLDELTTQRYARPDLSLLVRAAHHGVDSTYLREMGALGYRLGQIDALIAQRDHGVSPEYIREMRDVGYQLTLDELTTARDHGVSAEYVRQLKAQGRNGLTLDELVTIRDGEPATIGPRLKQSHFMFYAAAHVRAIEKMFNEFADRWLR